MPEKRKDDFYDAGNGNKKIHVWSEMNHPQRKRALFECSRDR
jgi:hypothetical protein